MSQQEGDNTEIPALHEEKFLLYEGQDLAVGITSCWGWLAI